MANLNGLINQMMSEIKGASQKTNHVSLTVEGKFTAKDLDGAPKRRARAERWLLRYSIGDKGVTLNLYRMED